MSRAKVAKPSLMLAKTWDWKKDIRGWWFSEKLDGVRCYWDGEGNFISRQGTLFNPPKSFRKFFEPGFPLDFEFWEARGMFQHTSGIVRRDKPTDEDFKNIKAGLIASPVLSSTIESDQTYLRTFVSRGGSDRVFVIAQNRLTSFEEIRAWHDRVVDDRGEGLIARRPGATYIGKRTSDLLKVLEYDSCEVTVVGHQPGEGKHAGRLGALMCAYGTKSVGVGTGFSDQERDNAKLLYPPGTVVSIRYKTLTDDGVPREPRFWRIRVEG
jgi:DNA ligase 1